MVTKIYYDLIVANAWTYAKVPAPWKADVKKLLDNSGYAHLTQ